MKVLMAASEGVPFARTGGLAEVVGMLAGALTSIGVETDVILPLYGSIDRKAYGILPCNSTVEVDMGGRLVEGRVHRATMPAKGVEPGAAYFIENEEYFDRPYLYGMEDGDYADNCERFVFFCRAAAKALDALGLDYDIIHCHDWQTALLPVYLRTLYSNLQAARDVRTVVTIHNLAFQGLFWHWDWPLTGLDWSLFSWRGLEFYGKMNLLKGGVLFADAITTVSKTYSREIQTPEYGYGLEGVFESRADQIYGVVSGLDCDEWNPATDTAIERNYDADDPDDKRFCKLALQDECGLTMDASLPLVSYVGRLSEQRGLDLLEGAMELLLSLPLQLVIQGEGGRHHQERLAAFCASYPGQACYLSEDREDRRRRIFAGSDLFLMPSRFEPCGLEQLIAMRYGAVPVVRHTGGLADTVSDLTPEGLEDGTATGFVFLEYNEAALVDEVSRALETYLEVDIWRQLIINAMRQDWSYVAAARQYEKIYRRIERD